MGNPPFLGGKLMRRRARGRDACVETSVFAVYAGRVPAEADLVCYWFAKAWEAMRAEVARSVRDSSRPTRFAAARTEKCWSRSPRRAQIFEAWSDEPWIDRRRGRAGIVGVFRRERKAANWDRREVARINADLSGLAAELITPVQRLSENAGVAFMGDTKGGAFDIAGRLARAWLDAAAQSQRQPE